MKPLAPSNSKNPFCEAYDAASALDMAASGAALARHQLSVTALANAAMVAHEPSDVYAACRYAFRASGCELTPGSWLSGRHFANFTDRDGCISGPAALLELQRAADEFLSAG